MDQRILALTAIGIISVLIFSCCIGEQKGVLPKEEVSPPIGLTAEQIRDKSVEAMDNVHSYAFDMGIKMSVEEGQGVTAMDMTGNGRVDIKNKRMYSKIDVGMLGMTMSTETYLIDNMQYIMLPTMGWVKNETEADIWETQDFVKSQRDLMKDIEVKLCGSENVNGVDCYILEMKPDKDEILQLLGQQMGDISGISSTEMSEMIKSIELKEWIAKDTFLVRRTVTDMQMETEGKTLNIEVTLNVYDYNKAMNIELPEEAKNAQDIEDLMKSGMTGYESY